MAALTPAEKQIALNIYKRWLPPTEYGPADQTDPFWKKTTPNRVLDTAADRIFSQVADRTGLNRLRDSLETEGWTINSSFDNPGGLLGDGLLIRYGAPQADQDKFDRAIFEILRVRAPDPPAVIDVNRADLLPDGDPILMEPYEEGQHIIQIEGNPNWVFDGASLSKYWKRHGRKTNPLVSGPDGPVVPAERIKEGTLHIVEESKGGRRRKTKKSKRRSRKTRRSV